ncbi:hypothetical protein JRU67_09290 [Mammaliicoccus sciuri]|uniref:Uncharacterized protein n=1 Tax=Mammaliicoccus sciuri TaxID=1296 RepID=A0AB37HKJ2_MAMSC|nr:hypothetical protein [Mammaliicoccus sciuri]QRN90256.1 hypothetical protein JRU67_09290 [Mammaliicoccus sciuri]
MTKNNDKEEYKHIICPRCNYIFAELHDVVMADTGTKIGETIKCPKCQI